VAKEVYGLKPFCNQYRIAAAEGEGVGHDCVEIEVCASLIGYVVQIAFGVGVMQVEGGGDGIVFQSQYGGHEFYCAVAPIR